MRHVVSLCGPERDERRCLFCTPYHTPFRVFLLLANDLFTRISFSHHRTYYEYMFGCCRSWLLTLGQHSSASWASSDLEWFGAEWILRKTMISLILLIWYFEENRNWSRRCKFRFCQPLYCYHLLTRLRYGKTEKHPRYMVAAARKQKYMALYQQHMR